MGNQFVSLYSDFICDNIVGLGPVEVQRLIRALARPVIPIDEFWMFILAKQLQKNISAYSGSAIVDVAHAFALRELEDDDFFEVLVNELKAQDFAKHDSLSLDEKLRLFWSCGRLRYRDEEIISRLFADMERSDHENPNLLTGGGGRPASSSEVLIQKLLEPHGPPFAADPCSLVGSPAEGHTGRDPSAGSRDARILRVRDFMFALGCQDLIRLDEPVIDSTRAAALGRALRAITPTHSFTRNDDWAIAVALTTISLIPHVTQQNSPQNGFLVLLSAALDTLAQNRRLNDRKSCVAHRRLRLILTSVRHGLIGGGGRSSPVGGPQNDVHERRENSPSPAGDNGDKSTVLDNEVDSAYKHLPMGLIRQMARIAQFYDIGAAEGNNDHEPESSGFHLEVCATLDQLRVGYNLEHKVAPFVLDLIVPGWQYVKHLEPPRPPDTRVE